MPGPDDTRLLVLLLPEPLEAFGRRALAETLLGAPGVVAVDPPRTSYASLARIPDALGVSIASKQAKRLRRRLPGRPSAVAIFDAAQYPLARGLLAQVPGCELWYGPGEPAAGRHGRLEELHLLAVQRSSLVFEDEDPEPLWERLDGLRVRS